MNQQIPAEARRHFELGDSLYINDDNYVGAIAEYSKALEIMPDYLEALLGRARMYRYIDKHPLSLSDYANAIALDSKNAEIYNTGNIFIYFMLNMKNPSRTLAKQ